MLIMKRFGIVILSLILLSFYKADNLKSTNIFISNNSVLSIYGTTNVNSFSCDLNMSEIASEIEADYQIEPNKYRFNQTILNLDNSCFDCGNKMMNKDFQKLLNSEYYPRIILELKEITLHPKRDDIVLAYIQLKIAGCSQLFSIPLTVKKDNGYQINGCMNLKLSDFNLEAPSKALGLIVVSDEIDIIFDLHLKLK